MQNTVIREFDTNPDVVTFLLDQGGSNGETREWLEIFWENYHLRGGVVFDAEGAIGSLYGQPNTGLPFGRGLIVDRDGSLALPYFGHQPTLAIETIHWLLGSAGAAEPGARADGPDPLRVDPNPFESEVRVILEDASPARERMHIFDASGRRIRTLTPAGGGAAPATYRWDGRSSGGDRVPAGVYFAAPDGAPRGMGIRLVRIP